MKVSKGAGRGFKGEKFSTGLFIFLDDAMEGLTFYEGLVTLVT
jgi:hypothetical protein